MKTEGKLMVDVNFPGKYTLKIKTSYDGVDYTSG